MPQTAAQTEDLCLSLKQMCAACKAILPDVFRDLDTCGSAEEETVPPSGVLKE